MIAARTYEGTRVEARIDGRDPAVLGRERDTPGSIDGGPTAGEPIGRIALPDGGNGDEEGR